MPTDRQYKGEEHVKTNPKNTCGGNKQNPDWNKATEQMTQFIKKR